MTDLTDLLGTAAFLAGLWPQVLAGLLFLLARRLWRLGVA